MAFPCTFRYIFIYPILCMITILMRVVQNFLANFKSPFSIFHLLLAGLTFVINCWSRKKKHYQPDINEFIFAQLRSDSMRKIMADV